MKIVSICGSLRPHSHTMKVLRLSSQVTGKLGHEMEIVSLKKMELPFCDGRTDYNDFPDVSSLRNKIQSADAILVATPEYHGTISGALKNAFDLISADHIQGKVVGFISVLGGSESHNSLNTLRIICRQLHAWALPHQLIVAQADTAFDENGEFVNQQNMERLEDLIRDLTHAAQKLS